MATVPQAGLADGSEGLICFVCDAGVVGRYYPLATCRTQTTKIRLIEKLGQLVGDEYMVVISEDDIICRGCATMINTLDRLEKELGSLKTIVLRYLEKKYDMDDGELVNTRTNPNPPGLPRGPRDPPSTDFQSRKRRAMLSNDNLPEEVRSAGKDCSWLQCDKCKYTTNYTSFMTHHARTHSRKKDSTQQQSSNASQGQSSQQAQQNIQVSQQQMLVQNQQTQNEANQQITMAQVKQNGDDKSGLVPVQRLAADENGTITVGISDSPAKNSAALGDGSETVEMIAAEIGQGFGNDDGDKGHMLAMVEVDKQMTLQAVEGEDGNNTLCMVDENGIIVQKVEQAEDGTLYVQVPDGTDTTKQVLSVADDGSVQMVEVLWDEMVSPDETEGHSMVTF